VSRASAGGALPAARSFPALLLPSLLSGLLLTGAFHPWNQAWLAWLFPLPLVLGLRRWAPGPREAALGGAAAGLAHFGTSLWWITEVTPAGWAALAVYLAAYPAAWMAVLAQAARRLPGRLQPHHSVLFAGFAACAWTALEWVRGWLLSGFPWNPIGASQIEVLVLAQVAELGGALLVGWMVVFGGTIIAMTLLRIVQQAGEGASMRPHAEFITALAVVGAAAWFGIGALTRPAPVRGHLDVLLVQPRIPQDPWGSGMAAEDALQESIRLTDLALPPGRPAGLVVWPETPIPDALADLPEFDRFVKSLVPGRAEAFLFGTIRREGRVPYNSAVLALPGNSAAAVYDKMHLVIMGEYVPLADAFPFLRRLVPLGADFASGPEPVAFDLPGGWRAAPLICFEDVMARVVRSFIPLQPDLFINITNDGWFNDSPQSLQHFQLARMRCIELRRPMLRAANNGATGWIDERGVVRELLRDPESGSVDIAGTLRTRVSIPEARMTFYARWRDWAGWLSALLVLAWICPPPAWFRKASGKNAS